MKEHDIRPANTTAEQRRLYESDVARLLVKRDQFVAVACPACAATESRHRFTKYTLDFVECAACATTYLSPRPTPELLQEYYESSENYRFWAKVIFPASESVRRERIFRPRVEKLLDICARYDVARNALLEVGPGFGTFCEEVLSKGAFRRVVAVEPTPDLAAACRARGVEVVESPVERAEFDEKFDVVCAFEVIEHLFSPRQFVEACARLLTPGGVLLLTCPNGRGFDIEVLGPGSPAVDVEHLNYFNTDSLPALVARCGFEVLEVQTPGKLDADIVRNRVLAGEAALDSPFLQRVLVEEWERVGAAFQEFLSAQLLSSNMWLVARLPAA